MVEGIHELGLHRFCQYTDQHRSGYYGQEYFLDYKGFTIAFESCSVSDDWDFTFNGNPGTSHCADEVGEAIWHLKNLKTAIDYFVDLSVKLGIEIDHYHNRQNRYDGPKIQFSNFSLELHSDVLYLNYCDTDRDINICLLEAFLLEKDNGQLEFEFDVRSSCTLAVFKNNDLEAVVPNMGYFKQDFWADPQHTIGLCFAFNNDRGYATYQTDGMIRIFNYDKREINRTDVVKVAFTDYERKISEDLFKLQPQDKK